MANNSKKKVLDIYPPHTFTQAEKHIKKENKNKTTDSSREKEENILIHKEIDKELAAKETERRSLLEESLLEPEEEQQNKQNINKENKEIDIEKDTFNQANLNEDKNENKIDEDIFQTDFDKEISDIFKQPSFSIFHRSKIKSILTLISFIAGLGLLYYLSFIVLAKAEVSVTSKKLTLALNNQTIIIDSNISEPNFKQSILPGNLFVFSEKDEQDFKSTGQGKDERKAKGVITIINNYSTLPQILVANTRFQTPDGKIFRLDSRIAIPGATTQDGKLIPSSIDAEVTADQAGPDYNIPPCIDKCKFTIPGFQGTPKFEGFYGQSKKPMTGGSFGAIPMVTVEDIKNAENTILQNINNKILNDLKTIPSDLTILDGAKSSTNITNLSDGGVTPGAFRQTFTVSGTGEVKVIAFKEETLKAFIQNQLNSQKPEQYEYCGSPKINYLNVKPDFKAETMKVLFSATQTLCYRLDPQAIQQEVAGKTSKELEIILKSLDGIETSKIKLFPFWIKKVPSDLNKIKVSID